VTPSLDALQAIATALNVPMFFFLDSTPNEPVVRAGARHSLAFPDSHLTYELLTPAWDSQMMTVLIRLGLGGRRVTPPLARPNEQWMFVLDGRLSINVDGTVYTLDRHDSIYYHGNLLREFACSGEDDVVIICTVIPPVL
jgi:hypothetical protein